MKRIVKILVLAFVCFLPFVVNAEERFKFDKYFDSHAYLYEENGNYYFSDSIFEDLPTSLIKYEPDLENYSSESFFDEEVMTEDELYNSRRYKELIDYFKVNNNYFDFFYIDDSNDFVEVLYLNETIYYYNSNTSEEASFGFNDNLDLTKRLLGKRYDVYNKVKDLNSYIYRIDVFDNISVAYYRGDNSYVSCYIFDNDLEVIMEYNSQMYGGYLYEKDGLIYVPTVDDKIEVYKLDGTRYDSFVVESEWFDYVRNVLQYNYALTKTDIVNNKIFLSYSIAKPLRRQVFNDADDITKFDDRMYPFNMTFVYDLNFVVDTVKSEDGEFTYDNILDETGQSFIELKIEPKDGYSVEEIIVTDVNGNRIEVTNNKFIMPMSDVTVEVKYVKGEYLPIPDTFLGKSVTVIFIGLVLISLGFYTINYVRQE